MLLLAGFGTAFGLQTILIIGGVTRLLPLTGVTLPFISYGGSSLLTSYIALGIMLLLSGGETGRSPISAPLRRIHMGIVGVLFALALVMGWWSIGRSVDLTARADNPRPAITGLYVQRGAILDRENQTLAVSTLADDVYERHYPASAADHLVGYDSLVIGKAGLERSLDPWLSCEQGYAQDVILGQRISTGFPPPGLNVRLSLDLDLQRRAEKLLADRLGAALLLDVRSGELLAIGSSPAFNANNLEANWDQLRTRDDAPLLNRATQAAYQPGMALAPFLAAWAHEQGRLLDPGEMSEIHLEAPVYVNGGKLQCLGSSAAPDWDLRDALRLSCPSPFAELGEQLRGEALVSMMRAFGFDRSVDVRLVEAEPPELRAPLGAQGVRRAAVGQGDLTVSPLQVIRAWASFFNGGQVPGVRLVLEYEDPRGLWQPIEPTSESLVAVSPETAALIGSWLRRSSGRYDFQAQALAGEGGAALGWYMGALARDEGTLVMLIVLEDEPPSVLSGLGKDLMEAVETALP
jgi:cell division protein FtsI/penicillin-binding protein 2